MLQQKQIFPISFPLGMSRMIVTAPDHFPERTLTHVPAWPELFAEPMVPSVALASVLVL